MAEDKDSDERKHEAVEEPPELEGHFILRLPRAAAASLRHSLESGALNLPKRLKIKIEEDMKHCKVVYDGWSLTGKVMDLPTVVECMKTLDRKVFYKVADICQILICEDGDMMQMTGEESPPYKDKMYMLPHGITAPLKNVRKLRFRKTLKKKSVELPYHEREVKRLFRQDLEASSVRYELISAEEEDKQRSKAEANDLSAENSVDVSHVLEVDETQLFGEISSSSEESEEDEEDVVNLCEDLMDHEVDISTLSGRNSPGELIKDVLKGSGTMQNSDDIMETESASVLQWESETAGENLGLLLQEQKREDEKAALREKVDELGYQISSLQNKQRERELEILSIENEALRERFQLNIDNLKQEICEKQREYNNIMRVLQEN